MKYSDLNLTLNEEVKTFDFNGVKIEVKQYLPISDKYDLIRTTLQKSRVDNIYDQFKITMYFQLNLIYMYTNIEFEMEDRINEAELYDKLRCGGLIQKVIPLIPEEEYDLLFCSISDIAESRMEFDSRIGNSLSKIIESLPEQMEKAVSALKNFNPADYENVMQFATAANGGRPIPFNEEYVEQ